MQEQNVGSRTTAPSVGVILTPTAPPAGDSYVTAFNGDLSSVNLNGYTLYINGVAVQ